MTVYFNKIGKDAKMVVKIPIKYFTNIDRFKFAIATVEPGQKEVTDVAGGGSDGEIQPFSTAAPSGTQVEYVKTYTYYLYDENGNILCELDKDGNIKDKYLYGNGLIAKRTDKTVQTTYFYHQDPVGSIIMITNNIGNILTQYKYTAFGTIMEQTGSFNNNLLFAGKEQDKNGLYSFPARYYSPGLGKFITTDPIRETHHSYAYAKNNPLTKTDPSGASTPYESQSYTYMEGLGFSEDLEMFEQMRAYMEQLGVQPSESETDVTEVNLEAEEEKNETDYDNPEYEDFNYSFRTPTGVYGEVTFGYIYDSKTGAEYGYLGVGGGVSYPSLFAFSYTQGFTPVTTGVNITIQAGAGIGGQGGWALRGGSIHEVGIYSPQVGFSVIYIWRIK